MSIGPATPAHLWHWHSDILELNGVRTAITVEAASERTLVITNIVTTVGRVLPAAGGGVETVPIEASTAGKIVLEVGTPPFFGAPLATSVQLAGGVAVGPGSAAVVRAHRNGDINPLPITVYLAGYFLDHEPMVPHRELVSLRVEFQRMREDVQAAVRDASAGILREVVIDELRAALEQRLGLDTLRAMLAQEGRDTSELLRDEIKEFIRTQLGEVQAQLEASIRGD